MASMEPAWWTAAPPDRRTPPGIVQAGGLPEGVTPSSGGVFGTPSQGSPSAPLERRLRFRRSTLAGVTTRDAVVGTGGRTPEPLRRSALVLRRRQSVQAA